MMRGNSNDFGSAKKSTHHGTFTSADKSSGNNGRKVFTAGNNKSTGGLPPTHPKGFGSTSVSHSEKLASLVNSMAPTPAIPGRTIRIIVNKQNSVSFSKSANRCFNRSDGKSVT